jgi:hypothetical protein
MFYGQHPYFTLARWQEVERRHNKEKCKELLSGLSRLEDQSQW